MSDQILVMLDAFAEPASPEAAGPRPFYAMAEVSETVAVQALELQAAAMLRSIVAGAARPA